MKSTVSSAHLRLLMLILPIAIPLLSSICLKISSVQILKIREKSVGTTEPHYSTKKRCFRKPGSHQCSYFMSGILVSGTSVIGRSFFLGQYPVLEGAAIASFGC